MAARCRRKLPESHWHHVLRRQTRWQDGPIKSQQKAGNTFPLAEDYANKLLPTGPCGMPPSPEPSLPCAAVGTASQIGRLMTATDVSDGTSTQTLVLQLLLLLVFFVCLFVFFLRSLALCHAQREIRSIVRFRLRLVALLVFCLWKFGQTAVSVCVSLCVTQRHTHE